MQKAVLMSAAYGWFAGLLTIMIIVTVLFALILYIALKPIKKDELDDPSAKKALGRREAELTVELLKKQNDAKSRAEIEGKLREVHSAQMLVEELMPEDEEKSGTSEKQGKPAKSAKAPAAKPARPAAKPQTPETAEKPAQPQQAAAPAANPAPAQETKAEGENKE